MNMKLNTVGDFSHFLSRHLDASLVFSLDEIRILPGYHVTEIKYARIESIDCGRGAEEWNEVVVQLLDGLRTSKAGYMSVVKFLGIVTAAKQSLLPDDTAQLFFEFSTENGPVMKLSVDSVEVIGELVLVALSGPAAVCKPFQLSKAGVETAVGKCCEKTLPTSSIDEASCKAGRTLSSCCG
ncbi:MAG: DUF6428 family protein [Granulosicoccus sp.]